MSKRLHSILKQAQKDGLVEDDATVSIRDGRAVIPIAAGNKRKLHGIIYDESSTGKTSYIEPNEIVEMNNEIRELEYAERREIVRILTDFSNDDEYLDLNCHFEDDPAMWEASGSEEATLSGDLLDNTGITGTDTICIVP